MWGKAVAVPSVIVMVGIELFQLTMIPAHMLASEHMIAKICARLIGSEFSCLDLLAYGTASGASISRIPHTLSAV
jgi:hypothetical protein